MKVEFSPDLEEKVKATPRVSIDTRLALVLQKIVDDPQTLLSLNVATHIELRNEIASELNVQLGGI